MARFLIDEQLPPALAEKLGAEGHDACHIFSQGLGGAADTAIWSRALKENRAVISKDEDFAARARISAAGPQVVLIRLGNVTNRALWEALRPAMPEIIAALAAGERLIEVA